MNKTLFLFIFLSPFLDFLHSRIIKSLYMRPKIILKEKTGSKIVKGFLWIYNNEIKEVQGSPSHGDIVDIYDSNRSFIGRGYFNPASKISIRILTRKDEEVNKDFFINRILKAWDYRKRLIHERSYRLVFSEADFLPGLIVDKFEDVLVIQTLTLGMDKLKPLIVETLDDLLQPKGIYERNDVTVRETEGLPLIKGPLKGRFKTIMEIEEHGLRIIVDIENGQKTGYFFDQRENREALRGLVEGAEVLDAFCYTGSFTLHAIKYGAKRVVAVDSSAESLEIAKKNVDLNGFSGKVEFIRENAFDLLRKFQRGGRSFDVVILDPPSFARSPKNLEGAIRGYKEINLRAMKILRDGGFLITCSCSQHITPEIFQDIIRSASLDANRTLRLVDFKYQAKDHPILPSHPETLYLKCGIYQVFKKI